MVTDHLINESLLQVYLFECNQLMEQLEQIVLSVEESNVYNMEDINQIFRIMHTIKGSSGMMQFNQIALLSHTLEDIFAFLRANEAITADYSRLTDHILDGIDFIKEEIEKIENGKPADGQASHLIELFQKFLTELQGLDQPPLNSALEKQIYKAVLFFEEGCEMENIRAFNVVHHLDGLAEVLQQTPEDLMNEKSMEEIRKEGFKLELKSLLSVEQLKEHLLETLFLSRLELEEGAGASTPSDLDIELEPTDQQEKQQQKLENKLVSSTTTGSSTTSMISVNVTKLDKLMDIVGEIVVAEALVVQNPDLQDLELDNFQKAARQLHKIINELQDSVLSIRMVPLKSTFNKMHRIVRDMKKKLNKDVLLEMVGEDTEVDKNIIEHISDPLMHLIRNALDHGIESLEERLKTDKPLQANIRLEAKSSGSDVLIIVEDDGKGLSRTKILDKAKEKGLLRLPEEDLSDKDVHRFILHPGFSTKENVTEFSGRGVGMDVVLKNIESLGGEISIDSREGEGTTITIRIPLTLAIMDGMNIRVGPSRYTIPITSIRESFRPREEELITDPEGHEMMMVRGECLKVVRLNTFFKVDTAVSRMDEGIMLIVEDKLAPVCLFADELIGEQQVVVKTLPNFIKNRKKIRGVTGCTLLGDGSISLILDFSDIA